MRKTIVFAGAALLTCLTIGLTAAQDIESTPEAAPEATQEAVVVDTRKWVEVFVPSAFIRAEPLENGERISSVFEGDSLIAVGRNFDGTWFLVRRPWEMEAAGWIADDVVSETFEPYEVPITSSIGIEGDILVEETGISVLILANANLREEPFQDSAEIADIPHSVTIPVVGRNQDGTWVLVNYNGFVGWVSRTVTQSSGNIFDAPLGLDLPPLEFEVVIVPPEMQIAQVERIRDYVTGEIALAESISNYWQLLFRGEILPCTPPPFTTYVRRTPQDIRELPELERLLPRMDEAITNINLSIAPLQDCGAIEPDTITEARNNAVNARIILENTLLQLDNIESIINNQVARPR